jgi:hypothetical protein
MNPDRRMFLARTGKFIYLLGGASLAFDYVMAGEPEKAPNYDSSRHWWAMLMDIDKCIGCGNASGVRKNDVPASPSSSVPGWDVSRASRPEAGAPRVDFPTAGTTASRKSTPPATAPRASSCPSSAITASILPASRSARWGPASTPLTESCWWTRRTVWAAATACRPARTAAATSTRARTRWTSATVYHRSPRASPPPAAGRPTGARQLADLTPHPIHEFLRTK